VEKLSNKVVTLVNSTAAPILPSLQSLRFLFDKEIIVLERDIEMIWKNNDDAGFVFQKGYEVESVAAFFRTITAIRRTWKK
jgi:hypothetical protein